MQVTKLLCRELTISWMNLLINIERESCSKKNVDSGCFVCTCVGDFVAPCARKGYDKYSTH